MKTRAAILALGLMLSGSAITAFPAHAQLFGESDEEKAARQAHEDGQDAQIKQLGDRIQQLEDKARNLTESLSTPPAPMRNWRIRFRICARRSTPSKRISPIGSACCRRSNWAPGDQGLNCGGTGVRRPRWCHRAGPATMAPGTPLPPINSDQAAAAPAPSPATAGLRRAHSKWGSRPARWGPCPATLPPRRASAPPSRSAEGQYDRAMNLLAKAQYAEASAAFRSYADANPDDHDLSAQAIYWIGDIAYVQHDYPGATRAFAEQIKKYPNRAQS